MMIPLRIDVVTQTPKFSALRRGGKYGRGGEVEAE